ETLAAHIDNAVGQHGEASEIFLIGHSMGGLVSRYYLESGSFKKRKGFKNVRQLITLGTPHLGAAIALPFVLGYRQRLFLSKDQVLQIASDSRYPAAYQLLPVPGEPFAWNGSAGTAFARLDIYDPAVAARLGLVKASLEAAQRFHTALDVSKCPSDV